MDEKKTPFRVVIIGAGITGLKCAHQILTLLSTTERRIEITILEAKDRPGGRILSKQHKCEFKRDHDGREDYNFWTEEGAAWIHGTKGNQPLMKLIEKASSKNQDQYISLEPFSSSLEINPETHPRELLGLGVVESDSSNAKNSDTLSSPSLIDIFYKGQNLSNIKNHDYNSCVQEKSLSHHELLMSQSSQIGKLLDANNKTNSVLDSSMVSLKNVMDLLEKKSDELTTLNDEQQQQILINAVNEIHMNHDSSSSENNHNDKDEALVSELDKTLVSGFFVHLLETWHGQSFDKIPLEEFITDSDSDDDNSQGGSVQSDNNNNREDGSFPGPHCQVIVYDRHPLESRTELDHQGKRCNNNVNENNKSEVIGGMSTILKPLLEGTTNLNDGFAVQDMIHLNHPVSKVELLSDDRLHNNPSSFSSAKVKVTCCRDQNHSPSTSGVSEFYADVCICTVSIGCLKASLEVQVEKEKTEEKKQSDGIIVFEPKLSSSKEIAIQNLQMGKIEYSFTHILAF